MLMTESDYLGTTDTYAGYCRHCDDVTAFDGIEPDSFNFALLRKGQPVITGGIILHGYEETYAVDLNSDTTPHYSIHT